MDTDYPDSQSVISGVTSQNEGGSCSERRKSFGSESTATDAMSTVSTQSIISSRSTHSALSRQGSTFTPLNLGKKERPRGRRRHRRSTVMGIPRHVQKELGLDRALWTAYQRSQEPVPSEDFTDMPGIVLSTAPAVDGPVPTGSKLQKAPGHPELRPKDDLALIQSVLPQGTSSQRPMSLAVPWATTAEAGSSLKPPSSPVMYISPQGMYLSKLIPNAVLPPSVDVVEINRNRSRNSVRTVSKCSLASASPAPSRTSSRASSRRSARPSESSGWSHSDSSETLVSDSSTISSSSTAQAPSSGRESVLEVRPAKGDTRPNGQVKMMERDQPTGQFTRSLSVMKRTKKPPPPSRSYSLHKDKLKRRSRDLAEAKIDFSGVTPKSVRERAHVESPGYSADESAVEESFSSGAPSPPNIQQQTGIEGANSVHYPPRNPLTIEKGLKRNLSPSSGYSSHNGTPKTKELHLHSAGDQKHAKSELKGVSSNHTKPAILALKALFEIPQPPKVTAPPPPPPETWAHNQRTFVLLCGPGPANIKFATPPKRPQAPQVKGETSSAEIPLILSAGDRQHATTVVTEQDSSSVSKMSGSAPHNLNLMQELLKAQQSLDKRDQSQMVSREKQTAGVLTGPPLSPPLPPPPPPMEMVLDCSLTTLGEANLPPPPPPFSPTSPNAKTYQGIPPGIPPPPEQPPPPPPQHPPPPPPVAVLPPKKDASPAPQAHAPPDIPKPPPLPVDIKTQPSPVTLKSSRKVQPPQKKQPPTTNDDSSSLVVTQSILQKVRLRSIKSNPKPESNVTEVKAAEQTDQKPVVTQVPPPKPIRRSLLLAEPPPDVAAVIAEAKSSPDATEQVSEAKATIKNSQSDTPVVNSQPEQPAVTSQLDSTISGSQSEVADSKPLPEPSAFVLKLEPRKLESQPEAIIADSKMEQSTIELERSSPVPDSQASVRCEPKPMVSKPEPEQAEPKPEQVSVPVISEPEKTNETSPPEPPIVDYQIDSATLPTQKTECDTSEGAPEQVAQNSKAQEAESECKPDADISVAKTIPETEPLALKSELEQMSEQTSLSEASVAPAASEPLTSKSDQESSEDLSVNQAKDQAVVSISDTEPPVSTDAAELNAAESKPEVPSVSSQLEPVSAVSKSESESVVSQVLPTTIESNSKPEPAVSKSESIAAAEASPSMTTTPTPITTTTTTVASKPASQPTIKVSASLANSTAPNTQTNKPVSPTSPTLKSPPVSANSSSMRLQEAIRQRAAARSATDGPAKRLSLHSPPATAGGSALKSPTSTASFIFSKSNKKFVSELSTAPQVQPGLIKTPQTESAAASSQSKQGDGLKNSKVPPPVASKPRAKMQSQRNGLHNPSTEETIAAEVQTAGQSAPSEDTRSKRQTYNYFG
ncbi:hypothetical protein ACEWY4_005411 [Coilia grayii]|uniref:Uncharacterized protein n=1 Tax=Coilia grayii TaxID=363190 RepID=A0ABD1KIW6_9TELE